MMMSFTSSVLRFVLAGVLLMPAGAQEEDADPDGKWKGKLYCLAVWAQRANPEEPKDVAEAFLNSTELRPRVLPGLGTTSFPIDTKSEEAQRWFHHGLACLHLLWDAEAERAFRQVLSADPECAMGFWGLAMANFDRPGRGAYFSRMAKGKIKPGTPPAIRAWIEPVARFFSEPAAPLMPRLEHLAAEFENLAMDNPDSAEAKALLLRQLVLNDYRGGLEVRSPWAVDRLASEVLTANPAHPGRQTRLLLWMKHRPAYLETAGFLDPAKLPEGAPSQVWRFLAEAQQAVGQWEPSSASLARALEIELAARKAWFDLPVRGPSFEDNGAALVSALSRLGRTREALGVAEAMMSRPMPGYVASDVSGKAFWECAYGRGLRAYIGVCREHRLSDKLAAMGTKVLDVLGPRPAAVKVREEVKALVEPAEENTSALSVEAVAQRELAADKPGGALQVLAGLSEAQRRPFLPRALSIKAHHLAKEPKEALFEFDEQFRKQAGAADSPLREDKALREVAAMRRVPNVWQLPAGPEALKLGTAVRTLTTDLRDSWPTAPEFTLPDGRGSTVSLASFRGKPVVIIFFLGAGCFQCVEQLHAFLPEGDKFKAAGIPIVCVSTDPVSVLKFTISEEKRGAKPIPFTILSDDKLEAFRSYHVYNEFETRPLHATFLIDSEGQVRWSHVDNQPFMKPQWLLQEAQRVLK